MKAMKLNYAFGVLKLYSSFTLTTVRVKSVAIVQYGILKTSLALQNVGLAILFIVQYKYNVVAKVYVLP